MDEDHKGQYKAIHVDMLQVGRILLELLSHSLTAWLVMSADYFAVSNPPFLSMNRLTT